MARTGEVDTGSPAEKSVQDSDVVTVELPAPDGWKKKDDTAEIVRLMQGLASVSEQMTSNLPVIVFQLVD